MDDNLTLIFEVNVDLYDYIQIVYTDVQLQTLVKYGKN